METFRFIKVRRQHEDTNEKSSYTGGAKNKLLHKAGGRVVSLGKRHQREVDNTFSLYSTKS